MTRVAMFLRCCAICLLAFAAGLPLQAEENERSRSFPTFADNQEWTTAVRSLFSLHKPNGDSVRGVSGHLRTRLAIEVRRDGAIADVRIIGSSGFEPADAAAVKMIRDVDRLPPFTPDMPEERRKLTLPVAFHLGPKMDADRRLYIDSTMGMRIEVPEPLLIVDAPKDPNFERGVQVMAAGDIPSYARANEPLCIVGFQTNKDEAVTQKSLNEQQNVEMIESFMKKSLEERGFSIEKSSISDYRDTKLIEFIQGLKPGAQWSDRKFYMASFDRPRGGYVVTCGATKENFPDALATFHAIRDGVSVMADTAVVP